MSSAITNQEYVKDEDASTSFTSQVIKLDTPYRAINYQFKWDADVKGRVTWQASIFADPNEWETLVNCESVILDIPSDGNGENHAIVSITDIWLTVGFL